MRLEQVISDIASIECPLESNERLFIEELLKLLPEKRQLIFKFAEIYDGSSDGFVRKRIVKFIASLIRRGCEEAATALHCDNSQVSGDDAIAALSYRLEIGKRIARHREALNLRQRDLAEMTGLAQSHISRLENGEHLPSHLTIEKLARALKVSPGEFDLYRE